MDASKNKAFLKSRMREAAQRREKRIDSPLVRYNELGQPVCKVCNVAVKSEALWPPHLASRSHKEAADRLRAQAQVKETAVTPCTGSQLNSTTVATKEKPRVSSSLPDNFWDQPQAKRASTDQDVPRDVSATVPAEEKVVEDRIGEEVASNDALSKNVPEAVKVLSKAEVQPDQDGVVTKKGGQSSLPEGFFDNVEADYKARGLEPPKFNIQDEWKDFEKLIQNDLQEVDLRLEEEELDAAEDREQLESLEQRELLDRVERLKRNELAKAETTEIAEAIAKVASRKPFTNVNLSLDEDSTSDGGSEDENALLDWRAKQF